MNTFFHIRHENRAHRIPICPRSRQQRRDAKACVRAMDVYSNKTLLELVKPTYRDQRERAPRHAHERRDLLFHFIVGRKTPQ